MTKTLNEIEDLLAVCCEAYAAGRQADGETHAADLMRRITAALREAGRERDEARLALQARLNEQPLIREMMERVRSAESDCDDLALRVKGLEEALGDLLFTSDPHSTGNPTDHMDAWAKARAALSPPATTGTALLEWIEHNVSGGLHLVAAARCRAKGDPRVDEMAVAWIERNDSAGGAAIRDARAALSPSATPGATPTQGEQP